MMAHGGKGDCEVTAARCGGLKQTSTEKNEDGEKCQNVIRMREKVRISLKQMLGVSHILSVDVLMFLLVFHAWHHTCSRCGDACRSNSKTTHTHTYI